MEAARLLIEALICGEAPVDGKRYPVDEGSLVAREVDQRTRDISCAGQPSEGYFAESLGLTLGVFEHDLHEHILQLKY